MKQYPRIHVQNLGPIREAEFEVRDFMVFVGPQASGKSTLAGAVHLMASFWRDLLHLVVSARNRRGGDDFFDNPIGAVDRRIRKRVLQFVHHSHKRQSIECQWSAEVGISIVYQRDEISVEYSWLLRDMLKEFAYGCGGLPMFDMEDEYMNYVKYGIAEHFYKRFAGICEHDYLTRMYYIPTDRIAASYIVNSYADFVRERFSHTILAYSDLISEMRIRYNKVKASSGYDTARELMLEILRGRFEPDPMGMDRLYYGDQPDEFVPLAKASSGQQDAAWMAQSLAILIHDHENAFIVIEEPEGHLFPEGQKMMTDLLGLLFNAADNRLVITTHSPYILSALNTLLHAADLSDCKGVEAVDKIIDRRYWIPVERVGAYLLKEGRAECMIDPDLGLINVSLLNTAMDSINAEDDRLLDLEYANV